MNYKNKELEDRINTFSKYYKNKYGFKVFKLGLSTLIPCPLRAKGNQCNFCIEDTFTDTMTNNYKDINSQIDYLSEKIRDKVFKNYQNEAYIAYFQENTSSYGDIDYLHSLFKQADNHPKILEIIISTRPDYINTQFLEILNDIKKPYKIEVGIQTIHNKSLQFFNRNHSHEDNIRAIDLLKKYSINTGAHLIIGCPLENHPKHKYVLETIEWINNQDNISDIKLHNLVVYKEAELANIINKSDLLNLPHYLEILTEIIKNIRPDIVISRLFTSNLNRHNKMLNDFPGIKKHWLNQLKGKLNQSDIYQGQNYKSKSRT